MSILPLKDALAILKFPNLPAMAVPENVDELSVALERAINEPSVSSKPKKPTFVVPSLYLNLIPRSKLSSELSSPISNTGSAIFTVVEFTVVVVPLTAKFPVTVKLPDVVKVAVVISSDIKFPETVKLFAIVTSLGRPTVIVCPLALVSISFAVPATVKD